MDKELEKFYESQFSLFLHPGWKEFMEDVAKVLEPLENVMTVTDAHQLHTRQGQIDILRWVLNRSEALKSAYDDLQAAEEADSA